MFSPILLAAVAPSILIQGGTVIDGSGHAGVTEDIRIRGDRIAAMGHLAPLKGERVIRAKGLVVAPGFVDAHSHADGGIEKEPGAISQITQGVTTSVVGQDGIWQGPVGAYLSKLQSYHPAINFAAFSGEGGIRGKVMGEDYKRLATRAEIERMKKLVSDDMKAGALGLSTGLEYDPGYYSNTEELIDLSKVAAQNGGMYISHMRDEANVVFNAIEELQRIGIEAALPAQISHVKLCSATVWGRAKEVCDKLFVDPSFVAPRMTADVYPYTFWQSGMAALTPSRDWEDRKIWENALADVGGPKNVRLTSYSEEKTWVGKNLAEIGDMTKRDPIDIIQEIMRKVHGPGKKGEESVAVTAMSEADVQTFIKSPFVMFSSDGSLGGTHPRSAGSFPRVLGRYARDLKVLSLPEAIRKMTSLPCQTFDLLHRGSLEPGYFADVVVFDPKTIQDRATADRPTTLSVGMRYVFVNGTLELSQGKPTGRRGGKALRRGK